MDGVAVGVFFAVSVSVVLLGVVVGPIPTDSSALATSGVAGVLDTYDTHDTSVTALSLETNTTYIPYTTPGTVFTLADGVQDNQLKTLVATVPTDVYVKTGWGVLKLESDHAGGEHSVTLLWSEETHRWEHISSSHSAPTWIPGDSNIQTLRQFTGVAMSGDGQIVFGGIPGSDEIYVYRYNRTLDAFVHFENLTTALSTADLGQHMRASMDGTVLASGLADYGTYGGVLVYRSSTPGGPYTELPILEPDDATAAAAFGGYMDMSEDGATILAGGPEDNDLNINGAVWAFDYNEAGSNYTQRGTKIITVDTLSGATRFGIGISCSADASVFVASGTTGTASAFWVFRWNSGTMLYEQLFNATEPTDLDPAPLFLPFYTHEMDRTGNIFTVNHPYNGDIWVFVNTPEDRDAFAQTQPRLHVDNFVYLGSTTRFTADSRSAVLPTVASTVAGFQLDTGTGEWAVGPTISTSGTSDDAKIATGVATVLGLSADGRIMIHAGNPAAITR